MPGAHQNRSAVLPIFLGVILTSTSAPARPRPPITDTEPPTALEAPAVVLSRIAELRLADPAQGMPATLDVRSRTKILASAGLSAGQVTIGHGAARVLEVCEGQTVRPDGSVVALPRDAIFVRDLGQGRAETRAAFPAVEVGAVVELHFRLRWDSVGPEVWTLDGPWPTLFSELVLYAPAGSSLLPFVRGPSAGAVQAAMLPGGAHGRLSAENLPAVVEEPSSPPLADLETRVVVVPRPLFDSWRTVCRRFETTYDRVRAGRRRVRRKAAEITAASRSPHERAVALHAFVRDSVRATRGGIATDDGTTLDSVLERREGRLAEKALLLQALLAAVGVPAELVWAFDWRDGQTDPEIVHPGALARVLVRAEPAGHELWLDPDDRGLAAGRLAPMQEGTHAIVVDRDTPRVVELPTSPAAANRRAVELDLELDREGRLSGVGELTFTGHHAWLYLGGSSSSEASRDTWKRWLENAFGDFEIGAVEVREELAEQRLTLSWTMLEHLELVLGEEATVSPSRPLGPLEQRYPQPLEARRTAVQVSFPDLDTVETTLRWPKGWRLDRVPSDLDHVSEAGEATGKIVVDAASHRLRYERRLAIASTRYDQGAEYAALRELYAAMERYDALELVLVRNRR